MEREYSANLDKSSGLSALCTAKCGVTKGFLWRGSMERSGKHFNRHWKIVGSNFAIIHSLRNCFQPPEIRTLSKLQKLRWQFSRSIFWESFETA